MWCKTRHRAHLGVRGGIKRAIVLNMRVAQRRHVRNSANAMTPAGYVERGMVASNVATSANKLSAKISRGTHQTRGDSATRGGA